MPTDCDFSQRLRTAMEAKDVSFRALSTACTEHGTPVSPPTLRAWAQGFSLPTRTASDAVLETLESLLSLPAGTLNVPLRVAQVLSDSDVGDPVLARCKQTVVDHAREWGLLEALAVHRSLVISELQRDGEMSRIEHRVVMRSVQDDLRHALLAVDLGSEPALEGVRIDGGRCIHDETIHESVRLLAVELETPLAAGESTLLRVTRTIPDAQVEAFHVLSTLPTRSLTALIQHEEGVLPFASYRVRSDVQATQGSFAATTRDVIADPGVGTTVLEPDAALLTISR